MIPLGIALHASGGTAAATCDIPQKGATKWSWQAHWIEFCLVACVGLVFREWPNCKRRTIGVLVAGFLIMVASFALTTYGSPVGEREAAKTGAPAATKSHQKPMKRYGSLIGDFCGFHRTRFSMSGTQNLT